MLIKSYQSFLNESFNINNFSIGDEVIVNGRQSDLTINNQKGRVGRISDDNISIEFDERFSNQLHNDSHRWTERHCWNIYRGNATITKVPKIKNKYINKIVNEFLPLITEEQLLNSRMVYIKHTDKPDMISYLALNKQQRLKDEGKYRTYWSSNQRQEAKVGKFLNKLFPDKPKTDIENYVNHYKSSYKQHFKIFDFKMVEGEDIRKFYSYRTYDSSGGRLHSSCMRQDDDQHRFDIYVENPDVCKMLILISPTDSSKITGRALVWKLANGDTYMDRIYCANDDEMKLFLNYAKEHGWRSFDDGGYKSDDYVKLTNDKNYGRYRDNPYMDSFTKYIIGPNELHSRNYGGRYDITYNDY